ncbi:MAG: relaxase [Pseudomonadota bacterium]
MILVGNQRGGASGLAQHLMADENDHVAVHDLRGFMADDLYGAFREVDAISKGTRCQQYLYSLSLNPPEGAQVEVAVFEDAVERAERSLGLVGQPRAIVFHEKEGRRHAHAVWSRIDVDEMKAINIAFPKRRLTNLGRELFVEHGWDMPKGYTDPRGHDPLTFGLEDWQRAIRNGDDPRAIKKALQDAWARSDTKETFEHALEERGYALARGDRRGFVAVDWRGEVYALPRQIGIKTNEVHERLGPEQDLLSIDDAKDQLTERLSRTFRQLEQATQEKLRIAEGVYRTKAKELATLQRKQRAALLAAQAERRDAEGVGRQARFRSGLSGFWDRLRGHHAQIAARNEADAQRCAERDAQELDTQSTMHTEDRRALRERYRAERQQARDDARSIQSVYDTIRSRRLKMQKSRTRHRNRDGPSLER